MDSDREPPQPFAGKIHAMLIRDPIHGDIELGSIEARVLDLPEVQRLREIKQLGTAFLVYPGCLHTRFDHSLGTCAAAHRIIASLRMQGHSVSPRVEQIIGAAAILHDVTHVPFGHTLEDERRLFPRHDKGNRLVRFLEGGLGKGLDRIGIRAEVSGILGATSPMLPEWAAEIVSSTIDADLLDYLRRDTHFAGLQQGYDDRIFRYFTIVDGRLALHMTKHGMERPDARSEIVQLLRTRYFLTERVYYHHTKVAAGAMISKAVESALDESVITEESLLRMGDSALFDTLQKTGEPAASSLINRIRHRNLLKRAYVISARTVPPDEREKLVALYHDSRDARRALEEALREEVGCAPGELILYCPALTVMKEAAARVTLPGGIARLNAVSGPELSEIKALEERYAGLWRLYVFVPKEFVSRAGPIAAARMGFPNEYDARRNNRIRESANGSEGTEE